MKKLIETGYVIYDKANDNLLQDFYGRVIIFGDKNEASKDCRGDGYIIKCTDLAKHWQEELLKQLNIE